MLNNADPINLRLLTYFNFFNGFNLYAPVAILYFAQVSGSFALGGAVFAIVMIAAALFEIPTGLVSDMVGRRKTAIYGAVAIVAGVTCYAIGLSFWLLALGAVFEGLSRSFFSGNNTALLHDTLAETGTQDQYHAALGRTSASGQVAMAVSAVLGAVVASVSFPLAVWLSVLPQIVCLLLCFGLVEPKQHSPSNGAAWAHLREALRQFKANRRLRLLTAAGVLDYGLGETSYQFQAAFMTTLWPVWAIGIAKMLSNVGAALSFQFSGRLIDRFTAIRILLFATVYGRVINLAALGLASLISPVLLASSSLLFGVTMVARSALDQREFTDAQRATMGSLSSLVGSLFFGVCAILVGLVADRIGATRTLLLAELCRLPVIWLYWRVFRHADAAAGVGGQESGIRKS